MHKKAAQTLINQQEFSRLKQRNSLL